MIPPRNLTWRDICTKDQYEFWLLNNCNRRSLECQAMAIFRREWGGRAESLGEMGKNLAEFIELSDNSTLVRFIAQWSNPREVRECVADCKEIAEEESDPHAARGIRKQE